MSGKNGRMEEAVFGYHRGNVFRNRVAWRWAMAWTPKVIGCPKQLRKTPSVESLNAVIAFSSCAETIISLLSGLRPCSMGFPVVDKQKIMFTTVGDYC
jgi:hypothetical protein